MSYQPYFVEVARLMKERHDWQPVCWLTNKKIYNTVRSEFPNAKTFNYSTLIKAAYPQEYESDRLKNVDPGLLQALAFKERIAISMMDRNDSYSNDFSYRARLEYYYEALCFWGKVLNDHHIDIVVFEEEPHQAHDYVLYALCEYLGVSTVMFIRTIADLGILSVHRFEEGSRMLKEKYAEKKKNWNGQVVELPENVWLYLKKLRGEYGDVISLHLFDQVEEVSSIYSNQEKSRLQVGVDKLKHSINVKRFISRVTNLTSQGNFESDQKQKGVRIQDSQLSYLQYIYRRKKTVRKKFKLRTYYNSVSDRDLDLSSPYILCALHYQPEKSTCPLGDRHNNQYLMIRMLRDVIPDDWKIYVKDHVSQFVGSYSRYGEIFRSKEYYDRINALPNVSLVPLDYDNFTLIDRARAVATITSTMGWEALIRGVPALVFGLAWYADCEGVYYTPDLASLKRAIAKIANGTSVNLDHVHLYIQALLECTVDGVVGGPDNLSYFGVTASQNALEHVRGIEMLLGSTEVSPV